MEARLPMARFQPRPRFKDYSVQPSD